MRLRSGLVIALLLSIPCCAGEPVLGEGERLQVGGKEINLKVGHLVPAVADWNQDGKKDLILGHFTGKEGNIKLLLNEGEDKAPVFKTMQPLQAEGKPIRMDAG